MSESVSLPALGESVTEGTVTRWLKNVGDRVEVDEPLLEVSTDKVDTEIPSPVAGVIEEILVQEDETVEVGTALVKIGDGSGAGAAPAAEAPSQQEPQQAQQSPQEAQQPGTAEVPSSEAPTEAQAPAPEPVAAAPAQQQAAQQPASEQQVSEQQAAQPAEQQTAQPQAAAAPAQVEAAEATVASPAPAQQAAAQQASTAQGETAERGTSARSHAGGGYVTPIVRKLANQQGVDLSQVTGTGVGGRIRKQDILGARSASQEPAVVSTPQPTILETSPLRGTTQPMSRLRKVVAERAVVSMQNSAQLTTVVEVDVTKVARLRTAVKDDFFAKTGTKLSFLPFFTLAAAEALRAYPVVNATVDGDSIVYPDHENISIAVDTERGLLTPVVRDAGELDIAGLAGQISDLAARTRDNKLKPDELAGGTFTVTNTGSRGALFDTPLVFLPQVAILGTGAVTKKPVVVSADGADAIAIRSTVYLALSYDHRIVDGADAARFLVAVKNRLEEGAFEANLGI
ncbi:MAG TPA: 2-oxoglutarate dehydrogenase, E2 component, dihydrolipoamide succinyltransferase [Humibacter sp.]|nr:2-oxoglutarate dehydrogenase, E2 component, dihydrolipoamide succinyltransferase [Humibacter sp.]